MNRQQTIEGIQRVDADSLTPRQNMSGLFTPTAIDTRSSL